MRITERHGLLVEATDPGYTMGLQYCWISDKRPASPTCHQILVHATGDTVADAVENALASLEREHFVANFA